MLCLFRNLILSIDQANGFIPGNVFIFPLFPAIVCGASFDATEAAIAFKAERPSARCAYARQGVSMKAPGFISSVISFCEFSGHDARRYFALFGCGSSHPNRRQ